MHHLSVRTHLMTRPYPRWTGTMLRGLLVVLMAGWLLPYEHLAAAQDVSVRAWTNERTVGDDDRVTYSIEVRGAPFGKVETPQAPSTTGLALGRSTPSAGRAASYEDGEVVQTITFRWHYRPLRPGQARIDPATVVIDGASYQTEAIDLEVEPQLARTRRAQQPRPLRDDIQTPQGADEALDGDVFVRAVVDRQELYTNEQLTIAYQLLFRDYVRPGSSRLVENWEAEGLWREELPVDMRPTPETVLHNGERYDMITLMRAALFPMRPGTHRISPLLIRTDIDFTHPVRSERSAPSDPVELRTDPMEITARPLPSGAPDGFDGAVGQFSMDARVNTTDVSVGDAMEITINLRGTGNLTLLDPLVLEAPAGVTLYEPETSTDLDHTGDTIESTATYTYTLIPRQPGEVTLPPVVFSYFDPEREAYETLRETLPAIDVREATQPTITQAPTEPRAPVEEDSGNRTTVLLSIAALLAGLAALYGWKRSQDAEGAATTEAEQSPLERAEAAAAAGEVDACYRALDLALRQTIAERSQQPAFGQSQQDLAALLAGEGFGDDTIAEVRALLQEVEDAQYAPPAERPAQMERAVDRARALVQTLRETPA